MKCLNKKCRENLYDWEPFVKRNCPYCGLKQIQGTRLMSLAERQCINCGKRISIAEDGFGQGRCIMCNMKTI